MLTGDRVDLYFTDQGDGPCAVFTHSWALNSDQWHYVVAGLLDKGYRCVTYDRRGHGRSDRHRDVWNIDLLADDLAQLLEHLDVKDVTLVGHSMGCSEIVRYVTRHGRSRVARAVFLAPILPLLVKVADNPRADRDHRPQDRQASAPGEVDRIARGRTRPLHHTRISDR
jgi:non-heme chloroperoxidase